MQPPLVGEGAAIDGAVDEGLGVVLPADLAPPPPHPTAKASTAAPPNSASAVLASDFIKSSILMSGRLATRVSFHCRSVAVPLSWVAVTVQLSQRCLRPQCAVKVASVFREPDGNFQ
jgi:hypothetical protein